MEETAPVLAYVHEQRAATYTFELYPQLWERRHTPLRMRNVKWKHVHFNESNHERVPKHPGVYMFIVAPRHAYIRDHTYIFYAGKATDLYRRYNEYLTEELGEDLEHDRPKIVDFLNRFRGHLFFNYHMCKESEIEQKEDYIVDHIYPWGNTRHKKTIKAMILPSKK